MYNIQGLEINIYTLDQKLQKIESSVQQLSEKIKILEVLQLDLENLENKVKGNEKLLQQKCEQRKCKKMSKKINNLGIKFEQKYKTFQMNLGTVSMQELRYLINTNIYLNIDSNQKNIKYEYILLDIDSIGHCHRNVEYNKMQPRKLSRNIHKLGAAAG